MPSMHTQSMIKYFKAMWQRMFHKEPEPVDTRHYMDIPRCGTYSGAKIVDNPDKALVIPADKED